MNTHRNHTYAAASRWRGIKRKAAMLALALVATGAATAAHAADVCFQDAIGDVLVFKKHKVPKPSDCVPLTGHQQGSYCMLDGTACGTSDGAWVRYKFQYTCSTYDTGTYAFEVERRDYSGPGSTCWNDFETGERQCSGTVLVRKVACPANKVVP